VTLLRDWQWHQGLRKWFLNCRLEPELIPTPFVPAATNWFVLVSPSYPWGSIKFHPAKDGGLAHTFPHQSYAKETSRYEVPWRTCSLCLDTPTKTFGRQEYTIEPYDPERRLAWHCKRGLAWLVDAARGELIKPGEPYELPQYPIDLGSPLSVAFSEGTESFKAWEAKSDAFGLVDFYVLRRAIDIQVVKCFRTIAGEALLTPDWGPSVTQEAGAVSRGLWLRLSEAPIQDPWQAPITWGDLRATCRRQQIDLDEHLRQSIERIKGRDNIGEVVIVGFPIPAVFGETARRMHWLGINLPKLFKADEQVPGFRKGKQSSWLHNRNRILTDGRSVRWLESENWFPDQLQTRGRLAEDMTSKKVLLLGAGALGSSLAELLVRAGVHSMIVMDSDLLEAGNLVRHTLTMGELNEFKAEAVAKHLNGVAPTAHIEFMNLSFPPTGVSAEARINSCDLVIDCTGNDEVLHDLGAFGWRSELTFMSVSFTLGAKRLFCFAARGNRFPTDTYRQEISPWLFQDLEEYREQELPREGLGCWHPVFPARADDVWLLASTALKWIEKVAISPPTEPRVVVFEQKTENGDFLGVERCGEPK
jgi:ThiF family